MTATDTTTEILNDLVAINNDRIEGYERAMKELDESDADLKQLFLAMVDESRQLKMELGNEIQVGGSSIESGTTASGKIYRAWMDVRAAFSGQNRKTVLANCEYGEDAAQRAYTNAIKEEGLPKYIVEMLLNQKETLKQSHDEIKRLRDTSL
jgi:uncharacterized protein (TIGR02284 family)